MSNIMKVFGENVFTDINLKKRVSKEVFKEFKASQRGETELSLSSAESIANAIKDWSIKRGATHFTHWFHPLTDLTAEKHDSFLEPDGDNAIIYKFSGKTLIKGEPDASSFPNGGLRSTFEARGYTVWDTSSPPFIRENSHGATLYIPTAFISYTGEALDKKVPLLRSMEVLNKEALRILKKLGNKTSKKVFTTLGVEQEYFLVNKCLFEKREDLLLTGRTLFGANPPKGQELSDHYFGKIKEKVINFMSDLDYELWRVGVSSKTRHNEVAPNQFEIASLFSIANLASDQNQIIMETIEKTAIKHDLVALLHEKPFAGVNGSGKHNNWSMGTDDGINLLEPGDNPLSNEIFILFVSAVIEAIDRYNPLLRMSAASATNDHRLGGHEAPPAIISIFLSEELTSIFDSIANKKKLKSSGKDHIELGVDVLPKLPKDTGDRNRTSPFAFTGNKFEFRMPGSSSTPSTTCLAINTIVAKVLREYADKLEKATNVNKTITEIVTNAYKKHSRIIFNGDGYDKSWEVEAKKRGLQNIKSANEAYKVIQDKEIIKLFSDLKILNKQEIDSRFNIHSEKYVTQLSIEAKTLIDIAKKDILPFGLKYSNLLADNIDKLSKHKSLLKEQDLLLENIIKNINSLQKEIKSLENHLEKLDNTSDLSKKIDYARKYIYTGIESLRVPCDYLESVVDRTIWTLPSYKDLLFYL